jgi:hypothetical protein
LGSDRDEPEGGKRVHWEIVLAVGVVVLACGVLACTLGAAGIIFTRRVQPSSGAVMILVPPTRFATVPIPTSTPLPKPTATLVPTAQLPVTATAVPEPTPTARATPTPTASPAPLPSATPTVVVCDNPAALGQIALAPGQAFVCTIDQDQLTQQLDQRPENPCSSANVTFSADGQVDVACRIGLTLRATAVVEASNCRLNVRVVSGTFGFGQLLQRLIDENEAQVPYGQICIDDAEVSEGEITVRGHRR